MCARQRIVVAHPTELETASGDYRVAEGQLSEVTRTVGRDRRGNGHTAASAPDLAVPRSLIAFTSPQVPICTRGRVAVRPCTHSGVPGTKRGVGTLRVPESSACAGAGLLDACCATGPSACGVPMALHPTGTVPARSVCSRGSRCLPFPSRTGGPPARDHAATAEADTWTPVPCSVPRSAAGHPVRRLVGSQTELLAGVAVDSAKFRPVRGSRNTTF